MPKTFRGYEIHEKIGSGGMSTLYRGTQKTLNRKVALKLLHPGLAEDEQFIARFELEARTASGIGHRNIVSVIDFGSEDDVYYIVMEYVDGLNLKEVHQKVGKLAHEIALAILEEVSYGLNAAHEAGVIHRDIKPGNVLLSSSGDVKIADFGLARQMSDIDRLSGLTVPGSVLGTPAYMSPEQATGRDVDHRSDIYSLGVMAYELLTREKPFQGKTYSDIRDGIVNREPEPLRMKVPVMPEIETLVATMLAKDPDRRYQSMRQVIRAVENCMESLDPSEGLLKHRRKYLAQFAKDPVGFSEKLRRMSVSSHLDRGFHYKNMGFAKIDSAMQEFRYVLFLDPDNENASAAVGELESQSKASAAGGGGAADGGGAGSGGAPETSQGAADDGGDGGGTRILSPGDVHAELDVSRTELARGPVRTRSRTGSRKGPHARWIVVAAGVLVIAAFAFWQLVLKPQPAETLAGERVTEGSEIVPAQAATGGEPTLDQPVSSVAVSSQPAGADVAIRRPGTDAFRPLGVTPLTSEEIEPGTWELLLTGDDAEVTRTIQVEDGAVTSLSIDIDQDADRGRIAVSTVTPQARVGVRRNGTGEFEQLSAATPTTTSPLKTGPWQVRVTLAGYEPMTRDVTVRKDQMTDLSFALRQERPKPAPDGYASVVAAPYADVYLDGKQVATQARRSLVQIASGRDHTLELRHPTFGIKRFTDVRVAAGDTLDLGSFTFEWSSLRVYCEPRVVVDVTIDGVAQDRQTPYSGHVGSGSHRIVLSRPGWLVHHAVVTNAEGKESLVTPSGADRGLTIEVAVNDEVSVQVILEKSE